jgi:hypothetical protein
VHPGPRKPLVLKPTLHRGVSHKAGCAQPCVLNRHAAESSQQRASSCLLHIVGRRPPGPLVLGVLGVGQRGVGWYAQEGCCGEFSPHCPAYQSPHSTGGRHGKDQVSCSSTAAVATAPAHRAALCVVCCLQLPADSMQGPVPTRSSTQSTDVFETAPATAQQQTATED